MGKQSAHIVSLWMQSGGRARAFDAVLSYEAAARDLTRGQMLYELVREAADVGSYPPDVRARLDAIDERRRSRAARALLDVLVEKRLA